MERKIGEEELLEMISEMDDRASDGRLKRLRFLFENEDDESAPFDGLAYEYSEEARLCWYAGAYVGTIVMTQLCFEETLRAHFRVILGVKGGLPCGKSVDSAGFADLIDAAFARELITDAEKTCLTSLRLTRNPYVHPKEVSSQPDLSRPDVFVQHLKIVAPDLVGQSVEKEAGRAILLLVQSLPRISRRLFP